MQEVQPTDRVEEEPQESGSGGRSRGRSRARAAAPAKPPTRVMPRLLARYREELAPQLQQEFSYANVMEIPKVQKVVINVGLGEALTNARAMEATMGDIAAITGQRPISRKARRSVAGFKLREGQAVGVMVTLRGDRMYTFLDKLFNTALPRIRDFRGVSRSAFDGRGNYALGAARADRVPGDRLQPDRPPSRDAGEHHHLRQDGPGSAEAPRPDGDALRTSTGAHGRLGRHGEV